jgi:hypothetical protein
MLLAVLSGDRGVLIADLRENRILEDCSDTPFARMTWLTPDRLGLFSEGNGMAVCERSESGAALRDLQLDTGTVAADSVDAAAALPGGALVYGASNGTIWLAGSNERGVLLFDSETVGAEAGSAFTFALDNSGRWLIPTRNDGLLKVYDLRDKRVAAAAALTSLEFARKNTVHVAFSPSGRHVAALSNSLWEVVMHVFAFDAGSGALEPLFEFPLPPVRDGESNSIPPRVVWLGPDILSVLTSRGEPAALTVDPVRLQADAAEIADQADDRRFTP